MAKSKKTPNQTSRNARIPSQTQSSDPPIMLEIRQPEDNPSILFFAEKFKNSLQLLIAIGIILVLATKLLYHADRTFDLYFITFPKYLETILRLPALDLVAKALAYAAGVDLAYMLLTPGPDEAIEPLILGLASAILYSISSIGGPDLKLAQEIGLYTIILSFLFLMKMLFISDDEDAPNRGLLASLVKGWITKFIK